MKKKDDCGCQEKLSIRMGKPLIWLIRGYQNYLSPLKKAPTCKFYPVCSVYAVEALKRFGIFKGTALAVWRILRCNPFSRGGYDPVPEKRKKNRFNDGNTRS